MLLVWAGVAWARHRMPQRLPVRRARRLVCALAGTAAVAALLAAGQLTYGRFASIEARPGRLTLGYVGPFGRTLPIDAAQVEAIRFARDRRACHLVVTLRSGAVHRGLPSRRFAPPQACAALQRDVAATLRAPAG